MRAFASVATCNDTESGILHQLGSQLPSALPIALSLYCELAEWCVSKLCYECLPSFLLREGDSSRQEHQTQDSIPSARAS